MFNRKLLPGCRVRLAGTLETLRGAHAQVALGGLTHWTVGLLATFMSVACVVAADTGAYAFGKTLGRTQLTAISPKKTVEGAFGGLLCSTALALGFWRVLAWPAHPALAARP